MSSILSGSDRQTPRRELGLISVKLKANAIIHAGHIVVAGSTGFAEEGKTATGLTYLGIADETIDNTGGSDGDVSVFVRTHAAFLTGQLKCRCRRSDLNRQEVLHPRRFYSLQNISSKH